MASLDPSPSSRPERQGLVALLVAGWLLAFVLSIVLARTTASSGDGFTRGLNRLTVFAGWQLAASALALVAWIAGIGRFKTTAGWRWMSRTPILIQLSLVLIIAGLISYVSLQGRGHSPAETPPGPPTATAAPAVSISESPKMTSPLDLPDSDPVEQSLREIIAHFEAMADELEATVRGESLPATTTQFITATKEHLRPLRQAWSESFPERRIAARRKLAAASAETHERLSHAIAAFEALDRPDFEVLNAITTGPTWADFQREPTYEEFRGLFRSGFETSHFFPLEGNETGPFWADASPAAWDELQQYLVERPGRASGVTVALTFVGYREDEGGYGQAGSFDSRVFIESIDAVRAITPEEFELVRSQTR